MAGKTFGDDVRNEVVGKTVMWGPAIIGGVLLGPVGVTLGLLASVVAVASGGNSSSSQSDNDRRRE